MNIQDVADAAEVSITTVSHALSGKGRLPAATRELVRRTADELGYVPRLSAQGLATGRSRILAIQFSGFESDGGIPDLAYAREIINAASLTALKRGYALAILPPTTQVEHILQVNFDGYALVDPTGRESLLDYFQSQQKAIVTMGQLLGGSAFHPYVDTDHTQATLQMMDHLWSNGYRRPCLLVGQASHDLSYVRLVVSAYRKWCRKKRVKARLLEVPNPPSVEGSRAAVDALLSDPESDIDCIYATLDMFAVGALQAAQGARIRTPEDFGVASITDSPLLTIVQPAVTAFELHAGTIAERAMNCLIDAVETEQSGQLEAFVPVALRARESTRGRTQA